LAFLPLDWAAEASESNGMTALEHFENLLEFETDCWDVHEDLSSRKADYIILDVRSPEAYAGSHVPGAINLPHGRIVERNLAAFPADVAFVVYCSGPHCNGADKAAVRLARLNRKVKKMLGGIAGWKWEGFELEKTQRSGLDVVDKRDTEPVPCD
jgi:rhodanese-related sulfurtransferase